MIRILDYFSVFDCKHFPGGLNQLHGIAAKTSCFGLASKAREEITVGLVDSTINSVLISQIRIYGNDAIAGKNMAARSKITDAPKKLVHEDHNFFLVFYALNYIEPFEIIIYDFEIIFRINYCFRFRCRATTEICCIAFTIIIDFKIFNIA